MTESVNKPWGYYEDIFRSSKVVFKRLVIEPNQRISYQIHNKRGEFWFIESGDPLFKFSPESAPLENFSVRRLKAGETIEIPPGVAHQVISDNGQYIIIWEIQYGECEEADIIRLEDPYKRE